MATEKRHKLIITGTGRAGTTLLVQLFTELGLDTGYTRETFQYDYNEHCKAGLERDVEDPQAPYVVKNPNLCEELPSVLAHGEVAIDYAIIPIRHLDHAAKSRIRIGGNGGVPGGLRGTADPRHQKAVLAENFHQLVETLTAHDIPHVFLHFPRFVQDPRYTYEKLGPVLGGISYEQFSLCFQCVAKPELIHSFAEAQPGDAGKPAKVFQRSSWRRRMQRRVTRTAGFLACFSLGWWAPWSAPKAQAVVKTTAMDHRADIDWLKQSFSRAPLPSVAGDGSLRHALGRTPFPGFRRFMPGGVFHPPMGLIPPHLPPSGFFSVNLFRLDPDFIAEKSFLGAELFMR